MDRATWCYGAAVAAVAGVSMAVTVWLAAPSDEPPAPSPGARAVQGVPVRAAALAPSFGAVTAAHEPGDPSGRWVGQMDLGGKSQVLFRFELKAVNGVLTGTAGMPIGEASIVNGRVRDKHVSFDTQHRLPVTGQLVLTNFSGEVDGDTIALNIRSEGAMSRLLVQRAAP